MKELEKRLNAVLEKGKEVRKLTNEMLEELEYIDNMDIKAYDLVDNVTMINKVSNLKDEITDILKKIVEGI